VKTTRQITLEDNENEIIVFDHKHQNGRTRVQDTYRPFKSVGGNSNLPDQERRILKLLTNTGNNILNDGTMLFLGTSMSIDYLKSISFLKLCQTLSQSLALIK
jgi:hypothetical protein